MEHSAKFEKVKNFYACGLWDKRKVHDAVNKAWITPEEYKEITNDDYEK